MRPVILVVDARGQSQSMAALLHVFSTFDDATRIAGVILNRVGSSRHADVLRQACEHDGIPVLGALPRIDELSVPSRHLGLITAVEHGSRARTAVDAMTALVAAHVEIDRARRGKQHDRIRRRRRERVRRARGQAEVRARLGLRVLLAEEVRECACV